jgi:hypothetical protein
MNPRIGWGQPPSWGSPHQTEWAPLVDPGPGYLHTARSLGRWLWPTLAVTGFLAVTAFVLRLDDPTPGLSTRGLLTIALAAVVVVLLTIRRAAGPGPLARALVEYTVVFVLAVLVATTGVSANPPPSTSKQASAADQRPALVKVVDGFWDWLGEWRQWARSERGRRDQATPTVDLSRILTSPVSSASTRRPL